jgi:hypothetical protein
MLFVMIDDDSPIYSGLPVHVAIKPDDSDLSWTVRLEEGSRPIRARGLTDIPHDATAVTINGPAQNILLFLWGRYEEDEVELTGTPDRIAALVKWMKE